MHLHLCKTINYNKVHPIDIEIILVIFWYQIKSLKSLKPKAQQIKYRILNRKYENSTLNCRKWGFKLRLLLYIILNQYEPI